MNGGKKNSVDNYTIGFLKGPEERGYGLDDGFYILDVFGLPHAGPYAREKDAKGQLTRLRKGYTPAARKI